MKNKGKIILDLCGGTGAWSRPYKEAGYDVRVITLPEYDILKTFCADDVKQIFFYSQNGIGKMSLPYDRIYGILAAPPCDQFSFVRTTPKMPRDLRKGMECVKACLEIIWHCQTHYENQHQKLPPLKFWAMENPFFASTKWFLGKPAFVFQPYEFGDGYKKMTALWGSFNPPIKQEHWVMKNDKKFDKLLMAEIRELKSPVDDDPGDRRTRKELRAITPKGFADAFYKANK
jgi:hypothetical protein